MSISSTSLHQQQIVDNPRHYTRENRINGGIVSGATRRFEARNRHAQIRSLRAQGQTLRQIASAVGYHASTVSRVLSGVIRTCLNRAETLALGPLKRVLRELSPPHVPPTTTPKRRRFDPFDGGVPSPYHPGYAAFIVGVRLYDSVNRPTPVIVGKCTCGYGLQSLSQVCPMCGRQPKERR